MVTHELCVCGHLERTHELIVHKTGADINDPTLAPNVRGQCMIPGCPCTEFRPQMVI